MRLYAKSVSSPDAFGFPNWTPDDPKDVAILVEVEIGEEGQQGADLFQVMLATPRGLERIAIQRSSVVISDRALVVMKEVSAGTFVEWLSSTLEKCAADTWVSSVERLQRYFLWEYEDYQPEQPRPSKQNTKRPR
jgi:hypothetical protein